MHELSVTQSILQIALDAAEGRRVSKIDLAIGDLSSIVDDSVQFYFDFLSQGTLAEGARLCIQRLPGMARCTECGLVYAATIPLRPACPGCGSTHIVITGGRGMHVESIEVEDGDPGR